MNLNLKPCNKIVTQCYFNGYQVRYSPPTDMYSPRATPLVNTISVVGEYLLVSVKIPLCN